MKTLITKYNGLTGQEYARATLKEKTLCHWHLNGNIYEEGIEVTPHQMLCIQTWTVEKVERIGNVDHIYLIEN